MHERSDLAVVPPNELLDEHGIFKVGDYSGRTVFDVALVDRPWLLRTSIHPSPLDEEIRNFILDVAFWPQSLLLLVISSCARS